MQQNEFEVLVKNVCAQDDLPKALAVLIACEDEEIAEAAKSKKIDAVVFDRGGYLYAGRVKAVAEAARSAGLNF